MVNLSLYISGQADQNDVTEFFQKSLMNPGENPIAFFEGVFYESHQERVGNIAFQDYLIYSDKAVYFWARGSSKDYLDRFDLGAVSVNSRNKNQDFATLNFKVRRDQKDPVYVIFDMVELHEAELITRLHTVIESIIEDALGVNYSKELPVEVSNAVLRGARGICIPQIIPLRFDTPDIAQQESHIGYGQDLLEQYKANIGYSSPEMQQPFNGQPAGAAQGGEKHTGGFSPADALKGIENMLPKDPASLKRVADSIKEMLGDAPLRFRDQVKNDLQHVPGMLSALNELLTNIADNPQAERFVMNIVKTAVRNDGMIGSVGKLIKLSSNFGSSGSGSGRRSSQRNASKSDTSGSNENTSKSPRRGVDDDDETPVRRRNIHIKSDDEATLNEDCFGNDTASNEKHAVSSASIPNTKTADDFDGDTVPQRKKITIKSPDEDVLPIVKNMMSTDDFSSDDQFSDKGNQADSVEKVEEITPSRKKIRIIPAEAEDEIHPGEKVFSAPQSEKSFSEIDPMPHPMNNAVDNSTETKTADNSRLTGGENDNEGQTHR